MESLHFPNPIKKIDRRKKVDEKRRKQTARKELQKQLDMAEKKIKFKRLQCIIEKEHKHFSKVKHFSTSFVS